MQNKDETANETKFHNFKHLYTLLSQSTSTVYQEVATLGRLLEEASQHLVKLSSYYKPFELTEPLKNPSFDVTLASLLDINTKEVQSVIDSYLENSYRGSKIDFEKSRKADKNTDTLVFDVWQFYRSEYLYLLKCLKVISTYKNKDLFARFLETFNGVQTFQNVLKELYKLMEASIPVKDSISLVCNPVFVQSWLLFHFKEQTELLQVLIALGPSFNAESQYKSLLTLANSIQKQSLSVKISQCQHESSLESSLNTLYQMQNLYIISLIQPSNKSVLQSHTLSSFEEILALMRRKKEYAPILLTYMVWHLKNSSPSTMGKYMSYGELAIGARVWHQMTEMLQNPVIEDNIASRTKAYEACYEIFALLLSSFESHKLGFAEDQYELIEVLLSNAEIARIFWNFGIEKGLGLILVELLDLFPTSILPFLRIFRALAQASHESAAQVVDRLAELPFYVDTLENVPTEVLHTTTQGQVRAKQTYHPFCNFLALVIPVGTLGDLLSDGTNGVRWHCPINGFHVLEAEMGKLVEQVSRGVTYVKQDTLEHVIRMAPLFSTLLESDAIEIRSVKRILEKILSLLAKFVTIPNPPLELLTNCLILATSALMKDDSMAYKLSLLRLMPYSTGAVTGHNDFNVHSGLLGSNLECEIAAGEFPLTASMLRYLLTLQETEKHVEALLPGVEFVLTHILPSIESWQFVNPNEKNELMKDTLQLIHNCLTFGDEGQDKEVLRLCSVCIDSLCNDQAGAALLRLIVTGQDVVNNAFMQNEQQGTILVKRIILALSILTSLLVMRQNLGTKELTFLELTMIHSSNAAQSHLIHAIFNYIYVDLDPRLATLAFKLLKRLTMYLEVSFLSCLGTEASVIKRAILVRLERDAENMLLQDALLGFLTQCVYSQVGLLQLFLETDDEKAVVFLDLILQFIQQDNELLKCAAVELTHALWHQRCTQAVQYLAKKRFWELFCQMFSSQPPKTDRGLRTAAFAFKVIAIELYYSPDALNESLQKFLQDWLSPSSTRLTTWSKKVMGSLPLAVGFDANVTQVASQSDKSPTAVLLLAGWRDLIAVLAAKNVPCSLPTSIKQSLANDVLQTVQKRLSPGSFTGVLTTLSELYVLLLKSFKSTDAIDNVQNWLEGIVTVLELSCDNFTEYPLRIQAALWTIFILVLKHVKGKLRLENITALELWADPLSTSLQQCLLPAQDLLVHPIPHHADLTITCLALTCFWNFVSVLSKFRDESSWLPKLQERYVLQNTLVLTETALQLGRAPELVQSMTSFYVALARGPIAARILGSAGLGVRVWLPLAALPDSVVSDHAWRDVYKSMTLFCHEILRQEKQFFWDEALNFISVNETKLIRMVLKVQEAFHPDDLHLTQVFLCLLSEMLKYDQTWRLQHPSSLQISMRAVSVVIHCAASYLIRPGFLQIVLEKSAHPKHILGQQPNLWSLKERMSKEEEGTPQRSPVFLETQRKLIQLLVLGLKVVYTFSPSISDLLSYESLDVTKWERIVEPSFSTPSIEPAQDICLTFGTLSTAAGLALKMLLNKEKRSAEETIHLQLVLEQSSALLLSQAVLYLLDPQLSSHVKPQLRRELGTELSALMETVKRSQKGVVGGIDRTFFKVMTHLVERIFK